MTAAARRQEVIPYHCELTHSAAICGSAAFPSPVAGRHGPINGRKINGLFLDEDFLSLSPRDPSLGLSVLSNIERGVTVVKRNP